MSTEPFIDEREFGTIRYRNEYVKKWSEIAAALRYSLRIEERDAYDAKASAGSPEPLEPGDFVEVKACKKWVENGDEYGTSGRWHITDSSHEELLSYGGYYCLIVYDIVEAPTSSGERVLIEAIDLVPASEVDEELFRASGYSSHRLGYKAFFPERHPSTDDPNERVRGDGQQRPEEPPEEYEGNGSEDEPRPESASESGESEAVEPDPEPEDVVNSGADELITSEGEEPSKAISNSEAYPTDLREFDIWVVWSFDDVGRKRPRAPWLNDHCYPVSWGEGVANRPETEFEEAYKFSRFGSEIQHQWPFPEDCPDKNLKLGMFLPHEPPEPRIMQIDLDNVRHPESGELIPEAAAVMEMFPETYAIISVSGTGIHLYVRASLPERMGKLVEPLGDYHGPAFEALDEPPQIELYDHGRFCAITGQHIEGAGTAVPEAQERIEELIEEYETVKCDSCGEVHRIKNVPEPEGDDERVCPRCEEALDLGRSETFDPDAYRRIRDASDSGSSGSSRSPYFEEAISNFGEPKANAAGTGEGFGGAHPAHGGTASPDSESTNYAVNVSENAWHCFAHGSGGGPLSLVAVMEGELDCRTPDLSILSDENYLRVCLAARDDYGFSGKPPYRALVGVARTQGLAMADYDEGILGGDCYKIARQVYDNMTLSDL